MSQTERPWAQLLGTFSGAEEVGADEVRAAHRAPASADVCRVHFDDRGVRAAVRARGTVSPPSELEARTWLRLAACSFPSSRTSTTLQTGARSRERSNHFSANRWRRSRPGKAINCAHPPGNCMVRKRPKPHVCWRHVAVESARRLSPHPVARSCPRRATRGVGRALVLRALQQANGRPVHVITFGAGHPGGAEAEAARCLYRSLGFQPHDHDPAADGTPRELLVLAER